MVLISPDVVSEISLFNGDEFNFTSGAHSVEHFHFTNSTATYNVVVTLDNPQTSQFSFWTTPLIERKTEEEV